MDLIGDHRCVPNYDPVCISVPVLTVRLGSELGGSHEPSGITTQTRVKPDRTVYHFNNHHVSRLLYCCRLR